MPDPTTNDPGLAALFGEILRPAKPTVPVPADQLRALVVAATEAVKADGGTRYLHESDEVGERCCCQVADYEPHLQTCWVYRLTLALAPFGGVR